jgi:hypothetical protein
MASASSAFLSCSCPKSVADSEHALASLSAELFSVQSDFSTLCSQMELAELSPAETRASLLIAFEHTVKESQRLQASIDWWSATVCDGKLVAERTQCLCCEVKQEVVFLRKSNRGLLWVAFVGLLSLLIIFVMRY